MEGWLYGLFTLIGVLAGSLFSYLGMKKRMKYSNRRFALDKALELDGLERQKQQDYRDRRREVRSEPLLKLRAELAVMATKLNMLVIDTRGQHYRSDITEEGKSKKLEQAVEDLKVYGTSGNFQQTLHLQYDAELLKLVEGIENKYRLLFEYTLDFKNLKADERQSFRQIFQEVKSSIPELQELINKRLEEL